MSLTHNYGNYEPPELTLDDFQNNTPEPPITRSTQTICTAGLLSEFGCAGTKCEECPYGKTETVELIE